MFHLKAQATVRLVQYIEIKTNIYIDNLCNFSVHDYLAKYYQVCQVEVKYCWKNSTLKLQTKKQKLKLTSSTSLMCALIRAASCVRISLNDVKCAHFLSMKLTASVNVNSTKNPNPTHTKIFDGSGLQHYTHPTIIT